jgi:hypothetical protein
MSLNTSMISISTHNCKIGQKLRSQSYKRNFVQNGNINNIMKAALCYHISREPFIEDN